MGKATLDLASLAESARNAGRLAFNQGRPKGDSAQWPEQVRGDFEQGWTEARSKSAEFSKEE